MNSNFHTSVFSDIPPTLVVSSVIGVTNTTFTQQQQENSENENAIDKIDVWDMYTDIVSMDVPFPHTPPHTILGIFCSIHSFSIQL